MTYNPGQLSVLFDCLPRDPKWLIIGGPADANEAQTAIKQWPNIKCIGCEPNRALYEWQLQHNWPIGHPLLPVALSDMLGWLPMKVDNSNPRATSAMQDRGGELKRIPCLTIDYLALMYGPFEDAILWLDIEGHEYEALCGTGGLLSNESILAVNVEIIERRVTEAAQIDELLTGHGFGFQLRKVWNQQPGLCEDRIYVRA